MTKSYALSAHLLVRWLERVEGANLSVFRKAARRMNRPAANDRDLIEFMEAYSAFDFDKIREHVGHLVASAVAIGADSIRHKGIRIPIGSGRVGKSAIPHKKPAHRSKSLNYGDFKRRIEDFRRREDRLTMQEARV